MSDSQQFVGRNRPPRVQIEYDVETYGTKSKVNLPMVVGVMSDLAGKSDSAEATKPVAERKFLEINNENFDRRMSSLRPKVSFHVNNTLTGEGQMPVSIEFDSLDEFAPDRIAQKLPVLNEMVQARNQLSALLTYMDGKSGAEELLSKIMQNPDLLKSIAQVPQSSQPAAAGQA